MVCCPPLLVSPAQPLPSPAFYSAHAHLFVHLRAFLCRGSFAPLTHSTPWEVLPTGSDLRGSRQLNVDHVDQAVLRVGGPAIRVCKLFFGVWDLVIVLFKCFFYLQRYMGNLGINLILVAPWKQLSIWVCYNWEVQDVFSFGPVTLPHRAPSNHPTSLGELAKKIGRVPLVWCRLQLKGIRKDRSLILTTPTRCSHEQPTLAAFLW